MTTEVVTMPASLPLRDLIRDYFSGPRTRKHAGYPVVSKEGQLLGMITQSNLLEHWLIALVDGNTTLDPLGASPIIAYDLIESQPETAYPDEPCRETAERLATSGNRRLPVVSSQDPTRLIGIVAIADLLKARLRMLDEDATRERFFNDRELSGGVNP
jgi:CBS domain-containing protein